MKTQSVKSTCSYYGVGCGVIVHKDSSGQLRLEGDPAHPGSQGMLCSKGLNLHYTVMDQSDRMLYPQMCYNRAMPLERVRGTPPSNGRLSCLNPE